MGKPSLPDGAAPAGPPPSTPRERWSKIGVACLGALLGGLVGGFLVVGVTLVLKAGIDFAATQPTWFILLVPPSLIYANGLALFPGTIFLESLFYFALALGAALLVFARRMMRWPFGPPWWAFTFPLDALAYAAARYAQDHPTPLWRGVCAATLLLATGFVLLVLWRTLRSAASRRG